VPASPGLSPTQSIGDTFTFHMGSRAGTGAGPPAAAGPPALLFHGGEGVSVAATEAASPSSSGQASAPQGVTRKASVQRLNELYRCGAAHLVVLAALGGWSLWDGVAGRSGVSALCV
jgi:hypothetical protein